MVQAEKTQILDIIKILESLNIQKILIDKFSLNEKNINSLPILGPYTGQELIDSTIKIISNLKREVNSNGWSSLPSHMLHHDFGNRHLISDLLSLQTQLSQNTIDGNYMMFIDWLIYYERSNNFWHVSENIIETEKLKEIENNIVLKNELYSKSLNQFEALSTQTQKLTEDINKLILDKTNELSVISSNLATANTSTAEIGNLLADSKGKNELLANTLKQGEEKVEEAKIRIEEERKKFEDFRNILGELQKNLNDNIDTVRNTQNEWDGKLEYITSKESFIITKEKEINDLTGFAAGVSLFHTFQNRKNELAKPVKNWFWGLIVAAFITLVGIIVIFSVTPINSDWSIFALNTLKSLPFFILLYFSIKQYSKERAIQEEYAFKSAVALTINAFADKLSPRGDTGKDKMILSSVDKVYEIPNVMKEKGGSIFSFRSKTINDTLKNLADIAKESKNVGK
ncbi:MAG: hypothetical protein SFY56_04945 [Bacteroidota bacterium]|nr:hypothetical protein [Bacteroidota bacterium]